MLARELAEGRDTIAGLAHHHGLPVETVLECWERCLNRGRQAGPECPLVEGPQPALSRFAGMC